MQVRVCLDQGKMRPRWVNTCRPTRVFLLCRPGALIAGTWAAMQYMGSEYVPRFHPSASPHLFLFQRLPPILPRHRHLCPIHRQHHHRLHPGTLRPRVPPSLGRRVRIARHVCERVRSRGSDGQEGMAFERAERACCGAYRVHGASTLVVVRRCV